jgi:glucose/arabinose dehydrogenase
MFHSQVYRKLWLAVTAAGLFVVAGCSNQPQSEATNHQAKNQPAHKAAGTAKKPATVKPVSVSSKVSEPPQLVTVPKGMAITATVNQTLATDKNHPVDSFATSLSAPLMIDGKTVIPKGARLTGHVVTVKKHELKVTLASVVLHGKSYDLETNSIRPPNKSPDKNNDKSDVKDTTAEKDKDKKDITTLPAKTQLTFKLAKSVTVPVRG